MIHEIYPNLLNNTFRPTAISDTSLVFAFQGAGAGAATAGAAGAAATAAATAAAAGAATAATTAAGDALLLNPDSPTCFPRYGELQLAEGFQPSDATYLFKLDDDDCFLIDSAQISDPAGYAYAGVFSLRSLKPKHLAFAAVTALHLRGWYGQHVYCGACGGRLQHAPAERMLYCPQCGSTVYPKISPVVIVGIYRDDELLLTKYAGRPYTNYALVAGFIEIGETPEEAIRREVAEEVGLHVKNLRYYKSQPWGFSESLLLGFFAELDGSKDIVLDTFELSEASWVQRADIHIGLDDVSLTNEMIVQFIQNKHIY